MSSSITNLYSVLPSMNAHHVHTSLHEVLHNSTALDRMSACDTTANVDLAPVLQTPQGKGDRATLEKLVGALGESFKAMSQGLDASKGDFEELLHHLNNVSDINIVLSKRKMEDIKKQIQDIANLQAKTEEMNRILGWLTPILGVVQGLCAIIGILGSIVTAGASDVAAAGADSAIDGAIAGIEAGAEAGVEDVVAAGAEGVIEEGATTASSEAAPEVVEDTAISTSNTGLKTGLRQAARAIGKGITKANNARKLASKKLVEKFPMLKVFGSPTIKKAAALGTGITLVANTSVILSSSFILHDALTSVANDTNSVGKDVATASLLQTSFTNISEQTQAKSNTLQQQTQGTIQLVNLIGAILASYASISVAAHQQA